MPCPQPCPLSRAAGASPQAARVGEPDQFLGLTEGDFRQVPVADISHPLADRVGTAADGTDWVATETRSRVVHLSAMRLNFLSLAIRDRRRPVLISDELSRLTPSFSRVWRLAGGSWVVRETTGAIRNGFDGRRLEQIEDAWSLPVPREVDEVSVNFLRPVPAQTFQLTMMMTLRHPARDSTVLGAPLEQLTETVGRVLGTTEGAGQVDVGPRVWGMYEPAGAPWDRGVLTEAIREQMPEEASAFVAGPGLRATLSAQRTRHGVEEIVHATVALGQPTEAEFERLRVELSLTLQRLTESLMPLVAMLVVRPGPADLLVPPYLSAPPIPLALLIGAPGVRAFALDPDELRNRFGARAVGRPRIPALLFDLGALEPEAWLRLDAILGRLDPDKLTESLGGGQAVLRAAQLDRPNAADERGGTDEQP